jgi:hypothetical protein
MSIEHGGAPAASIATPSAPAAAGFRDPAALTRWLKILLYLSIALSVLSIVSGLFELKLLSDIGAGRTLAPGEAEGNDLRQQIIGGVRFAALIATIVTFAIWIYRANYNARQLGAAGMRFSPGWAVGWYFIPIANLWKPYQAMKEIWQASAAPENWQQQPRGSILPLWWTFFLLSNILGNATFRLTLRAKTVPELITAGSVSLVSDVVDVVSTVIALALVTQIFRMQMERRAAAAFT